MNADATTTAGNGWLDTGFGEPIDGDLSATLLTHLADCNLSANRVSSVRCEAVIFRSFVLSRVITSMTAMALVGSAVVMLTGLI